MDEKRPMTDQHPITPPPDLFDLWRNTAPGDAPLSYSWHLVTQAARWGADQELEACCEWLISNQNPRWAAALQEGRRPAPQPADGEVAELVAWLRKTSRAAFMDGWPNEESINLTRAADLLERLSPSQPVPVSEQLPGLDAKCWWFDSTKQWYFRSWVEINIAGLRQPTHWLPAHALPLPSHD